MWKCPQCGEVVVDQFAICWRCGVGRDGTPPDASFAPEAAGNASELGSSEENDAKPPVAMTNESKREAPVAMTNESKREALDWLLNSGRKYQLPFTEGRFAVVSLIGTESWTDYAQVVLQMMIADSLLNIEEKLDRYLDSSDASE